MGIKRTMGSSTLSHSVQPFQAGNGDGDTQTEHEIAENDLVGYIRQRPGHAVTVDAQGHEGIAIVGHAAQVLGGQLEDATFERVLETSATDSGRLFDILHQVLTRTQEVHSITQTDVQFDTAHAKGLDRAIHFGKQISGFDFISVGANALDADRFAVEVNNNFFVPGAAAQADADGSFHGGPRMVGLGY